MLVFKVGFIVLITVFLALIAPTTRAQVPCSTGDRNQGLISGTSLLGFYGNPTGQCVNDPKAAYANFKVPSYSEIKSVFFTQNKSGATATTYSSSSACPSGTMYLKNLSITSRTLINVQCQVARIDDAGANGPFATAGSNQMVIIFAEGDVYIDSNLNYGGTSFGLVIIAKGDIYISGSVTSLNAILVGESNIYTTTAGLPNLGLVSNSQQLTVNGSIISLSQNNIKRIYFNRSLILNSVPAEVVNYQPKYLVLLRGLMTQSYTVQREIGPDEIPAGSLFPSPTLIPSPPPGNNPGSTFQNAFCVYNIFKLNSLLNIASDTDIQCR